MARRAWKVEAYKKAVEVVDMGYELEKFTDWHWRLNGIIDIWPSSQKYMVGKQVKHYQNLKEILIYAGKRKKSTP